MPKKKDTTACIYVNRTALTYFAKDLEGQLDLPLSSDIVRDQEIISQPSLERVLNTWVEQTKLEPCEIILVLDDVICFYNHIPQMPLTKEDPTVTAFTETVPFDELWVENFPVQDGAYTTVVNHRFLRPLITSLEKVGFRVVAALPAFALGVDLTKTPFNKEMAIQVIDHEILRTQYNFISKAEASSKVEEEKPFLSFKIDLKVILMIVAFIGLIAVLVVLLKLQGMI